MGIADPVQLITALSARVAARRSNEAMIPGQNGSHGGAAESSAEFLHRMNRGARSVVQRAASRDQQEIRLPQWPDAVRGVPNVVLRSALFSATRSRAGERHHLDNALIASMSGVEIRYTGDRLDQGDMDVWQVLLHMARHYELGAEWDVTAYHLLRELGQTDTGGRKGSRSTLERRLRRLRAALLTVSGDAIEFNGNLVAKVDRDKRIHRYAIRMDPHLQELFGVDRYTYIDWQIRQALDGQALAQWLHGFYSSHAAPHPITTATLHKLCGSEAKHLFHFRAKLNEALGIVSTVSNANGQQFRASMDGDLVLVERTASKAQRKHLGMVDTIPSPVAVR